MTKEKLQTTDERYQWMCNRDGGQSYGNQEEIRPLTVRVYEEYVRPRLRNPHWTCPQYRAAYPSVTHYNAIRTPDRPFWQVVRVGSLSELEPSGDAKQWPLRVDSFDSSEAIAWGRASMPKRASVEFNCAKAAHLPICPPVQTGAHRFSARRRLR